MLTRCCSPPEKVAGGSGHSGPGMLSRRSSSAAVARAASRGDAARDQRLGDDVERRHARHGAQELADVADGVARSARMRRGAALATSIVPGAVTHQDLARGRSDSCRRSS